MADKPGPLLYKPAPRWQVLAAFGGALAIHGLAAVIAGIHKEEPPADLSAIPEDQILEERYTKFRRMGDFFNEA